MCLYSLQGAALLGAANSFCTGKCDSKTLTSHTHAKPLGDAASTKGAMAAGGQAQLAILPGQRAPQPSVWGAHTRRLPARLHYCACTHTMLCVWYMVWHACTAPSNPPPASSTCGCISAASCTHRKHPYYTHTNTRVKTGSPKKRAPCVTEGLDQST